MPPAATSDLYLTGQQSELAWQDEALCAQTDPDAFFPEKGHSSGRAKRICTDCAVRAECLAYAMAKDERFGIWGGLSERERRRLRKATREAAEPVVIPVPGLAMTLVPAVDFGADSTPLTTAELDADAADDAMPLATVA